ncbi:MAG: TetR/AcrR family transcriptional regulator, partial [Desulfobacterium sp.]
ENKLNELKIKFINVYESDPVALINLFHLQSGETLKNTSSQVINQIKKNSSRSLGVIANIVEEGMEAGVFTRQHPVAVADIIWSTYSGVILWVNSKRFFNNEKDFVKQTLEIAFEILFKGLKNSHGQKVVTS